MSLGSLVLIFMVILAFEIHPITDRLYPCTDHPELKWEEQYVMFLPLALLPPRYSQAIP